MRSLRNDADLLAAHVAGDRYAFEELFCRHRRQLYRLAVLSSRSVDDAEDSLQDAMLAAHRAAPSFRYNAAVTSWLHRIVVNTCLDRLRRTATSTITSSTTALEDNHWIPDRTARIDTALDVQHALQRLSIEQRTAVVAVDMLGYSVADTAAILCVPEGTIKSRCSRARTRLAALLSHLGPQATTAVIA